MLLKPPRVLSLHGAGLGTGQARAGGRVELCWALSQSTGSWHCCCHVTRPAQSHRDSQPVGEGTGRAAWPPQRGSYRHPQTWLSRSTREGPAWAPVSLSSLWIRQAALQAGITIAKSQPGPARPRPHPARMWAGAGAGAGGHRWRSWSQHQPDLGLGDNSPLPPLGSFQMQAAEGQARGEASGGCRACPRPGVGRARPGKGPAASVIQTDPGGHSAQDEVAYQLSGSWLWAPQVCLHPGGASMTVPTTHGPPSVLLSTVQTTTAPSLCPDVGKSQKAPAPLSWIPEQRSPDKLQPTRQRERNRP